MATTDRRSVPAHLVEHEDDEQAGQRGYVKGTDFALPYFSRWSRMREREVKEGLFRHVNCGYLSTHGVPPTLLALKQHAQSLCILIYALNPTIKSGEIASGDPKKASKKGKGQEDPFAYKYELNDSFDFLSDLTVPYTNDDPNHNKPLLALANEVRGRHEALGTTYHCPFAEAKPPRAKGEKQRPYANHHALIMHTNACLERLDHEFSSTGGLLSILPTSQEHDDEDLGNARNSLLGQWLLFTQHLVARMHDLERSYGNALDALAGEAAIPHQYLAGLGPDGRAAGREIAYPQDRWVLVNAGDDVFEHVHDVLDRQEALVQARERVWRRNGAVGDYIWESERGGREYARGIVPVNIMTRYYRLAGQGRNTLFVLPAWEHHPGVAHTRETEAQPTVVACVQPKFPERATELEKRYTERIYQAQRIELENERLRDEDESTKAQIETLKHENRRLRKARDELMLAVGEDNAKLAARVHEQRMRAVKAEKRVEVLMTEIAALQERLEEE
ncbi:hypothetical protein MFIFM68171_06828 [Madurella fahalii]|uniref:Uncharacterized protein n=1 Tax=Madurella fahalii TaxID=1157608 RepID=A0ABQ0GFT4_9PEZI